MKKNFERRNTRKIIKALEEEIKKKPDS